MEIVDANLQQKQDLFVSLHRRFWYVQGPKLQKSYKRQNSANFAGFLYNKAAAFKGTV